MMRKLIPFFILILALQSKAQTGGLQAGPVLTFLGKSEKGYGAELIANIPVEKKFSIGAGVRLMKFNSEPNLYTPVFATFKLSVAANKVIYFFNIDPGYGIHSFHNSFIYEAMNGKFQYEFKNSGGFYLGTGAGLRLKSKASPYINLQYSMYGFKYLMKAAELSLLKETGYIDHRVTTGITLTAGIWLHAKK